MKYLDASKLGSYASKNLQRIDLPYWLIILLFLFLNDPHLFQKLTSVKTYHTLVKDFYMMWLDQCINMEIYDQKSMGGDRIANFESNTDL